MGKETKKLCLKKNHATRPVVMIKKEVIVYIPVAQLAHSACPVAGWWVPNSHSTHSVAPSPLATFPAEQLAHVAWPL
jgi:hypothetical protein